MSAPGFQGAGPRVPGSQSVLGRSVTSRALYAEAGCGWMRPKRGVVLNVVIMGRDDECCSCRVQLRSVELRLTCDEPRHTGSCDWSIASDFWVCRLG